MINDNKLRNASVHGRVHILWLHLGESESIEGKGFKRTAERSRAEGIGDHQLMKQNVEEADE